MRYKLGNKWPYQVTKADLKIQHVRGSGPGGQKRNKTYSGVRITHLPTGISTRSDELCSQSGNLSLA